RSEGRDPVAVARDLVAVVGASAGPILDELCVRDDLAAATRQALAGLRARLGDAPALPPRPSRVLVGTGTAGQVIVAARGPRTFVVHLGPDGALERVAHGDDGTTQVRALRERLRAEGFVLRPA